MPAAHYGLPPCTTANGRFRKLNQACGYVCTAGPGYDGPTGWGTPNGTAGF